MYQNGNKTKLDILGKPSIGNLCPCFKLRQRRGDLEPAALELDRGHAGGFSFFTEEQIVAPSPPNRDPQRVAVHIDDDTFGRSTRQINPALIFVAVCRMAFIRHSAGNRCNGRVHPVLPFWIRLKIRTFSL